MADKTFQIEITKDTSNTKNNCITFDIKGDAGFGFDKSIINSIRRTILSSVDTVSFDVEHGDLQVIKNTSPLHNEFMTHRIGLVPLYIDPLGYEKQYLFHLKKSVDSEKVVTNVTMNDFQIYPLLEGKEITMSEDFSIENYDRGNPLSQIEKNKIFRPFEFRGKKNYCLLTELRANADEENEIEVYGIPSITYGYGNSRASPVSNCSYFFKKDEEMFQRILQEKIKIHEIPPEKQEMYEKELFMEESERYFHRDDVLDPYWYTMNIDSVHIYSPKELFIEGNEILKNQLNIIKKDIMGEKNIISLAQKDENVFVITIQDYDDTIGNLLQSHISRYLISEESVFSVCGYKRVHPLERKIQFTISFNGNNEMFSSSNEQKITAIIELFNESINSLSLIFDIIIQQAQESL